MPPRAIRSRRTARSSSATTSYVDAGGSSPDDHSVTIAVGEKVTFDYAIAPQNNSVHNVDFDFETQPSSCVMTAAPPGGEIEPDDKSPVPNFSQPPGWAGECTFNSPGTYTFFCDAHGDAMSGEVVVTGTATPTPTSTVTATPTATVTATPTSTPTGPTIAAHDNAGVNWFQDASQSSTSDNSVTVKVGDRVTFNYPSGAPSSHNVTFPNNPSPGRA